MTVSAPSNRPFSTIFLTSEGMFSLPALKPLESIRASPGYIILNPVRLLSNEMRCFVKITSAPSTTFPVRNTFPHTGHLKFFSSPYNVEISLKGRTRTFFMPSDDDAGSCATMREVQAGSIRKRESSRQHNFKHKDFCFFIMVPWE